MPARARATLTKDRVLAAAVALADEDGIEALSMRRLGAVLGVEAMSLYNHVENKAALLDGILDRVVREVELPARTEDWDVQLRQLAHSFRRVGHRHPGVLPLFGQRAVSTVEGFAPLERAYEILREAGLSPDVALASFITVSSFVFGFAQTELGGLREVAEGPTIHFGHIDLDEHPRLAEMGVAFANSDSDREFAFGLDLLVEGLRRLISGG